MEQVRERQGVGVPTKRLWRRGVRSRTPRHMSLFTN